MSGDHRASLEEAEKSADAGKIAPEADKLQQPMDLTENQALAEVLKALGLGAEATDSEITAKIAALRSKPPGLAKDAQAPVSIPASGTTNQNARMDAPAANLTGKEKNSAATGDEAGKANVYSGDDLSAARHDANNGKATNKTQNSRYGEAITATRRPAELDQAILTRATALANSLISAQSQTIATIYATMNQAQTNTQAILNLVQEMATNQESTAYLVRTLQDQMAYFSTNAGK